MKTARTFDRFALLLPVLLLILAGCAAGMARKAPPGTTQSALGEDALVFGSVRWIENDEVRERAISLRVLRVEDMKKGTIQVEKDGGFHALLPTGSYIIHRIDWRDPWDGPHWLVPQVAFKVEDNARAYYLGMVVVDIKAGRDFIGGLRVEETGIRIEDEGKKALDAFSKRCPDPSLTVAKSLAIQDESVPRFAELEDQRFLLDILGALYFGIMPTILY